MQLIYQIKAAYCHYKFGEGRYYIKMRPLLGQIKNRPRSPRNSGDQQRTPKDTQEKYFWRGSFPDKGQRSAVQPFWGTFYVSIFLGVHVHAKAPPFIHSNNFLGPKMKKGRLSESARTEKFTKQQMVSYAQAIPKCIQIFSLCRKVCHTRKTAFTGYSWKGQTVRLGILHFQTIRHLPMMSNIHVITKKSLSGRCLRPLWPLFTFQVS